uniref:UDP-GlcNAc:betaGal beta-1,3-N-acetylglucosaminyltransferase-like protein 1 isoform X1 n=1 Tax=Crassostrea virginica TaxID=6565 RepID=A0A8B8CPD8_CRAVI|nr:UDP-GlcNAc:betaGal beta-1,3-N-acetylglucosaminyltransferase-like protein 1 isoform X1 [Crassostrea virginica]
MTDVSIIIPVYNGENWIDECLEAVQNQQFKGQLEVSIYNDGSTDGTLSKLEEWRENLKEQSVVVVIGGNTSNPRGVGYAKNKAVNQSSGTYLCFQDIDDVMSSDRVSKQFQAAKSKTNSIVGSQFHRKPDGSTERFTKWANQLTPDQLYSQIYTSHGPTLIMPTWFCHRSVFSKVGGFSEGGKGEPEDLIFFLQHLEMGGGLCRVDSDLLMYRYHPGATTFSIHEDTIWKIRMEHIQKQVIDQWETFTIWNAGKQGKKFYRFLTTTNQKKVSAFCDVDPKKIKCGAYVYHESKEKIKPMVPIVHFKSAKPPFIICMKLDLTAGEFEKNLASLNLREGVDFFHFN